MHTETVLGGQIKNCVPTHSLPRVYRAFPSLTYLFWPDRGNKGMERLNNTPSNTQNRNHRP